MTIPCGGCGGHWTGTSRAHCAACHRTFSGMTAFDAHHPGACVPDLLSIGLTVVTHAGDQAVWGRHIDPEQRPAHWAAT